MPTENRSSNTEMVSVPRDLIVRASSTELGMAAKKDRMAAKSDLRAILAKPADQRQGEPVAWRYQVRTGGQWYVTTTEPHARMFAGSDEGAAFEPLYARADPGEVERLKQEIDQLKGGGQLLVQDRNALRAQLAERDALLARTLPYLSNTPDLVQHGAEDLAEEIRRTSAGTPCYGPNEWGTECGRCSKCKPASKDPSAPIELETSRLSG